PPSSSGAVLTHTYPIDQPESSAPMMPPNEFSTRSAEERIEVVSSSAFPLVATRQLLTSDLYGPRAPAALWLPSDWESWDYPSIDDPEAIRQWFVKTINNLEFQAKVSPELLFKGWDIPNVRDAYRLVRHLQAKRRWANAPEEPRRRYPVPNGLEDAANELKRIWGWVDDRLSTIQEEAAEGPAKGTGSQLTGENHGDVPRQDDTKDDKAKKAKTHRRAMNREASDCARRYKAAKRKDSSTTMKSVVDNYVTEVGGSASSILRVLNDNPDQWKAGGKNDTENDK
ncbi:MAG: hypothetical protein ABIP48_22870, partial [Planctomycetota bacterium]